MKVDLNADVGESYGRYTLGLDEELIPLISSANIACGFHAGDPVVLEKTVGICEKAGTGFSGFAGLRQKKYEFKRKRSEGDDALPDWGGRCFSP